MTIVSVDLAFKSHSDIGVVALRSAGDQLVAVPLKLEKFGLGGKPQPHRLATFFATLAGELDARFIVIDGPQGWKDPDNGLEHCRRCERKLATQGKTGLPGHTKPANYRDFIEFSIALFDALHDQSFERFSTARLADPCAVESFPTSAWKTIGLPPLPGKAKATDEIVRSAFEELAETFPIRATAPLNHDELQATVAGLAAIALEERNRRGVKLAGVAPFERDGHWREGFIVNPTRSAW